MKALTAPGRPPKQRPRQRCPICDRLIAIDNRFRLSRHGGYLLGFYAECEGSYMMARP